MRRVGYDISLGGLSLTHEPRQGGAHLVAVRCSRGIGLSAGECVLDLALPVGTTPPSLADPVQVALDGGVGMSTVFTGTVDAVTWIGPSLRISAADSLCKLSRVEVSASYEDKTPGDIVRDLLERAGLKSGTIDDGPSIESYVLHGGPRALAQLRQLASRCGRHLFSDGEGRANFVAPPTGPADRTFTLGEDVLQYFLEASAPNFDGVLVWGEGTGAGDDKVHWLAKELKGVRGEAALGPDGTVRPGSAGQRPLIVKDGAVRTGDAASKLAEAICRAAVRPAAGFIDVPGAPDVDVGKLVAVKGLPAGAPTTSPLLVRRIYHRLDADHGFITRVEV